MEKNEGVRSKILIAGDNFGCGSSHEYAAWAMLYLELRAAIAPSVSDIFASIALKNAILTVELSQNNIDQLLSDAKIGELYIDLAAQTVQSCAAKAVRPKLCGQRCVGRKYRFDIEPFLQKYPLEGTNEIATSRTSQDAISAFEKCSVLRGRHPALDL